MKLGLVIPKCIKKLVPDFLYVRIIYLAAYGKLPDLNNPETFDEKLQWYKLKWRNPIMTRLADKYEVRNYLKEKGYGHLLNELYFVKDNLEVNDFERLPEQYVIKATHGCNMNIFNDGKLPVNKEKAVQTMDKWLASNLYDHGREWAYKNIKPRVIAERYLENTGLGELLDYKFYCYDGKPVVVWVCGGRRSEHGVRYKAYDMDWNELDITKGKESLRVSFERPGTFDEMKEIVSDLSRGFPFIRVDLYSVENRVYFSEFTFYPDSGIIPFTPPEYNKFFGDPFKLIPYKKAAR